MYIKVSIYHQLKFSTLEQIKTKTKIEKTIEKSGIGVLIGHQG